MQKKTQVFAGFIMLLAGVGYISWFLKTNPLMFTKTWYWLVCLLVPAWTLAINGLWWVIKKGTD
jgi:hypothetical protein